MSNHPGKTKQNRRQLAIWKKATIMAAKYSILLEQDDSGGYYGQVPSMPNIFGYARTPDQCVENTRQALIATLAYGIEFNANPKKNLLSQPIGKATSSKSKKKSKKYSRKTRSKDVIDVAILTALREELEPVLVLGGGEPNWERKTYKRFQYYIGKLPTKKGTALRVVATSLWKYGPTRTSSEVNRLSHFKPRLVCMVGICAGWKDKDISLGDVIVADRAYQALEGKLQSGTLRPDIATYHPPPYMVGWLHNFTDKGWIRKISAKRPPDLRFQCLALMLKIQQAPDQRLDLRIEKKCEAMWSNFRYVKDLVRKSKLVTAKWRISDKGKRYLASSLYEPGKRKTLRTSQKRPEVHYGAFATVPYVLEEDRFFESEAYYVRKVKAADMELAAFFETCHEMGTPGIAAKAVCDYADKSKNDLFHPYATEVAASYLYGFLDENEKEIRKL